MGRCLKITAGLLLLVQAFQLAALQDPTNSPRRTINKDYLRALAKKTAGSPNTAITEEEMEYDPGSDGNELNNEYSNGIASGSMTVDEEENGGQDKRAKKTSGDVTVAATTAAPTVAPALATTVATTVAPTAPSNVTANQTVLPKATTSTTPDASNTSRINVTEDEMEFHNSTTMATTTQNSTSHLSAENSTSLSVTSNHTDLQTNTTTPDNDTQEFTTKGMGLTNATESTNTTTPTATTTRWINETSTTSETTNTTATSTTPEKGSSADRGLATETHTGQRHGAWGAVLGTAVAVVCLGVVAYMILKRKHQKGFSHSKLVDDFPSDPVLRLDNSAPLDLNFGVGGSAYYNPGLQGDNIHMSSFPGRR